MATVVAEGRDAETGEGYPAPRTRWWTVGVLTLLYAVSFMDRQIFAVLLEPITRSLAISDFQAGLLHGLAFALCYAIFGIFFGSLVDRFPRRPIIFIGVTVWSIAATTCGMVGNAMQLAVARFGVGAGEASLLPAANSLLSDSFPRSRLSTAISIFGTGTAIGGMLSYILAATLLSTMSPQGIVLPLFGDAEPWRVVLLVTGLPGLLLAFLVFTFPDPVRKQRLKTQETASYRAALAFMAAHWRFFLGYFVGIGLMAMVSYGFSSWKAVWLIRSFGLSVAETAMTLALLTVIPSVIGVVSTGAITDYLFSRGVKDAHLKVIIVLSCVKLLAATAAMMMTDEKGALACVAVYLLATGSVGVAPAAVHLVTPNDYRGKIIAVYGLFVVMIGLGFGPPLVGAITTYGYRDPAMIGWSIVTVHWIFVPIALLGLWSACSAMRQAVDQSANWNDQS